ncbi:MAG: beta-lactamase family protein [Gemmatimonadetes bacterium]|nr:beta-lactamase family protein [Gemmatimonadota bacterium]
MTARSPHLLALLLTLGLAALPAGLTAQTVSIERGQLRSGSLETGDTARFTFEAGEDFLLYGEVNQISVDVVVTLTDAEGRRVGPAWDTPARGAEAFSTTIETGGTYTLNVAPFEDEEGDFEVRILQLEERSDDPEDLADQLMFAYSRPGGPGGAVQVWRNGRTVFSKAYGLADLAHEIPFRTTTPTNIGSTSKQFTAFAVMLQAERGLLDLDDDIREHVPELPEFDEIITIRHLLTHTSGLREFLNLYSLTGAPATGISRDHVITIAQRQPSLQNSPGEEWNYNNTAFSLAATIVERTSDQDFDDFLEENVFGPLGMESSVARMEPSQLIPGRADGYTPGGSGWMAPGDLGGAIGAGGIYASVEDLQRWGENMLEPTVGTAETVEAMMTEHMLNDGEGSGYGFGLFIDEQRGLLRRHHGGADVSHRSMIVHYPEIEAGLTVQSNAATFNSANVAFQLGAAFFGDEMEPEEEAVADAEFDASAWDREDFDVFEGSYSLDEAPQMVVRFWRDEETLYTQMTGQQALEVEPVSPTRFRVVVVDAQFEFETEEGEATGATLYQGGREMHATRVAEDEVEEAEWSPEDLTDFVGRFYSEEIETFYEVRLDMPDDEDGEDAEPRLVMNQLWMGDRPMSASTDEDTFTAANMTLQFERDRHGTVTGFYVDVTRTRDVRFVRVDSGMEN